MSKRKIAYARKNVLDPEEEGEELPFPPREITVHKDYWYERDYELQDEILGRGKFGEVIKCKEISSGLALAAKIVSARKESEKSDVRKEIRIMCLLRHPKILQIYDAFESKRQMCLITELIEGGELFDRIVDENFELTERVAILFMRQITDAMMFIHSQNILHLDMKPENIICVAKTGTRIKIIDFGLAQRFDSFSSTKVMAGTIDFMSPEVCNYEDVTPATDMWSVGVICYVLVSGLSPFMGDDDADTICNILRVEFDFAAEEFDDVTAGCKDFIKKLLVKDPRKRMSAADCMKHSWLNKITRSQTNKHLSKKHHIKFFTRRKWRKVIKAVMAVIRLKMLVAKRKADEATDGSKDSEPNESPRAPEIPTWRKRMEARLKLGEAKAAHKSKTEELAALACVAQSGRSLTSSLSCSSGYESSSSGKSIPGEAPQDLYEDGEEEVTTPVVETLSPFEAVDRDLERMESVETIVNDEGSAQNQIATDESADNGMKDETLPNVPCTADQQPASDPCKDELGDDSFDPGDSQCDEVCELDTVEGDCNQTDDNETRQDIRSEDIKEISKPDIQADTLDTDSGILDKETEETLGEDQAADHGILASGIENDGQTGEYTSNDMSPKPKTPTSSSDEIIEFDASEDEFDSDENKSNDEPDDIDQTPDLTNHQHKHENETDEPVDETSTLNVDKSPKEELTTDQDQGGHESEPDFLSDSEDESDGSYRSDNNPCYCPTDTENETDEPVDETSTLNVDESPKEELTTDQDQGGHESEPDFLSDSEDESEGSYRSDKPCYCPTDTLDDLVSAITTRKNSNHSVRSNNSGRQSNVGSIPSRANSNKVYDSEKASNASINTRMSDSQSDISQPERTGTPPRPKYNSPGSSTDVSKLVQHSSGSSLSRYKRKTSKASSDRSCDSPCDSYLSGNSRQRRPSADSEDSFCDSPTGFTRRRPSPASRYPLSSRNHSSEQDLSYSGDVDYNRPRRQRWSQSPAHDMSAEQRRRARIASICGEEYTPPPLSPPIYDPYEERRIPIEIERSPPPTDFNMGRKNRISSVLSNDSASSDSALHRWRSREPQPIRGRVTHSPIRNEVECFGGAVKVRVRTSPIRRNDLGFSRVRESPSRGTTSMDARRARIASIMAEGNSTENLSRDRVQESPSRSTTSMDARRARIAAIMAEGDSTENLSRERVRESPLRSNGSQSYTSGSSQERRRARISAIMSGSQDSVNHDDSTKNPLQRVVGTTPPGSHPTSRTNSDDARHRRIAAIMSNSDR